MPYRVLIVAPEHDFRQRCASLHSVESAIREAGYCVACIPLDGPAAESIARLHALYDGLTPDLLVVDVSHASDLLLRHVRALLHRAWPAELPSPLCLAILSPLQLGEGDWLINTDDFQLSPSPDEIVARIKLLLLRQRNLAAQNRITLADMSIDLSASQASGADRATLALTPREFGLLRFLAEHRGNFFSRSDLLDLVWGSAYKGGERTVDIHVRRLRAKLPPGAAGLLETRRGVGYGFRRE